jgi:hypothetical protein
MDGSSVDFIVIPIVAIISLAAWLVPIYRADSHPRKSPRTATVTDGQDAVAGSADAVPPVAGPPVAGPPVAAHPVTAHPVTARPVARQGTVPRQPAAPAEDALTAS